MLYMSTKMKALLRDLLELNKQAEVICSLQEAKKEQIKILILKEEGAEAEGKYEKASEVAKVVWVTPKPSRRFQDKELKADNLKLWEKYYKANPNSESKPQLRITFSKQKGGDFNAE